MEFPTTKLNKSTVQIFDLTGTQNKEAFEIYPTIWGRFGFDGVIVCIKLRVRALFSVINEQLKLNANNVIEGNFGRSAARMAA